MSSNPALPVRWFSRLLAVLLPALVVASPAAAAADDEFLPVRSAYQVTTEVEADTLLVQFRIAAGYYLYRDRLGFESPTPGVTLGQPLLPAGLDHEDEFFGRQVIYRDTVQVGVPVSFDGHTGDFDLQVKLQGCADAGLCYPPQNWTVRVASPAVPAGAAPVAVPAPNKGGFSLRSLFGSGAKSDADFLLADQAFVLSATSTARDRIQLRFDVADDYYLYRDKLTVATSAAGVELGRPAVPGGETQHDEYFGEQVVFHGEMVADIPVVAAAGVTAVPLEISYQGCADAGLCYPPIKKTVLVQLASTTASAATLASATTGDAGPMRSEQDLLADRIRDGNLLAVLATFFGFGLLLAFTPCVLPMVPILSGIIVGAANGGQPVTRGRAFALSVAYVLGMALTYTIAGAVFAAAGQQAQAFSRNRG
jgi:thioredoxin:protein disulfide reductase